MSGTERSGGAYQLHTRSGAAFSAPGLDRIGGEAPGYSRADSEPSTCLVQSVKSSSESWFDFFGATVAESDAALTGPKGEMEELLAARHPRGITASRTCCNCFNPRPIRLLQ